MMSGIRRLEVVAKVHFGGKPSLQSVGNPSEGDSAREVGKDPTKGEASLQNVRDPCEGEPSPQEARDQSKTKTSRGHSKEEICKKKVRAPFADLGRLRETGEDWA